MRHLTIYFLLLFVLQNCENAFKKKSDPLTKETFTADKIGWTIQLPGKNWAILRNEQFEGFKVKSKKELEKIIDTTIVDSKTELLIGFRKNKINKFFSTIMPYDIAVDGDYDKALTTMHEFLKYRYASDNIPTEYELGATRIGGVMLDWFNMKEFSSDKKKETKTVRMFSCLLNNYFFSMTISYDNEHDQETLMNIVNSSKFSNVKE